MERKASDFSRGEINQIAVHYATTSCAFSALYYVSLHDISEATFYSLIGKAIKEHIVSEQIARMIAIKSAINSEKHGGEGGKVRSQAKYRRLMEQRKEFQFSRGNKEYYAIEYANADYAVDMKVFAGIHYMSRGLLQRTLVSAVVDNIVSDEVVEKLCQKAKQHNPAGQVERLFRELKSRRQANIEEKKVRKKQRRMQRSMRNEDDDMKALIDALMLDPENKEKRKQLEFIQVSMTDYGIPDEMAEQMASLEAAYQELEEGEDENKNNDVNPDQLSFWD